MAKQLQSGDLDRKMDVLQKDVQRGPLGDMGTSYGPVFLGLYCKKTDLAGSEKPIADRETAQKRSEFIIRYREGINETMIIRFEGKEYDITDVGEVENTRRQWTKIMATKRN
jgi:SPP1 family predicted phage head-tail adaptor